MKYIIHSDTCVLYDDMVLRHDINTYCVVGLKRPDSLGNFDIINLGHQVVLPHVYDVNNLLFKIKVDVDDAKTLEHIITVKTYVDMKKISNNKYEKDLPIYKSNLKILVPILRK